MKQSNSSVWCIIMLLFLVVSFGTLKGQKSAYKIEKITPKTFEVSTLKADYPNAGMVALQTHDFATIVFAEYTPWIRAKQPDRQNRNFMKKRWEELSVVVLETENFARYHIWNKDSLTENSFSFTYHNRKDPYQEELIQEVSVTIFRNSKDGVKEINLDENNFIPTALNDTVNQVKFQLTPYVEDSDIVEIRYKRVSPIYRTDLTDYYFQKNIPVIKACYELLLPEYFLINYEATGIFKLGYKVDNERITMVRRGVQGNSIKAKRYFFEVGNLPPIASESLVWAPRYYVSGVQFELKAVRYLGYTPYADKWRDILLRVKYETDFERNIRLSAPFKAELLRHITAEDDWTRIQQVFAFVKSKIRWNKEYDLYQNSATRAINSGEGNNAQINSVLLASLNAIGLYAYPVFLCSRSNGFIPFSYNSLKALNTYVVGVEDREGTPYYLDGSADYGTVNVFPTDLLVKKARTFDLRPDSVNGNVDLTALTRNTISRTMDMAISETGEITGKVVGKYQNLAAQEFQLQLAEANSSGETFLQGVERVEGINIDSFTVKIKDEKGKYTLVENSLFSGNLEKLPDGRLALTPLKLLIPKDASAHFRATTRMLPVELDYPYVMMLSAKITLPANMQIGELPNAAKWLLPDQSILFDYNVTQQGNQLNVQLMFVQKRVEYAAEDYPILYAIWEKMGISKQEKIIIEKK